MKRKGTSFGHAFLYRLISLYVFFLNFRFEFIKIGGNCFFFLFKNEKLFEIIFYFVELNEQFSINCHCAESIFQNWSAAAQ